MAHGAVDIIDAIARDCGWWPDTRLRVRATLAAAVESPDHERACLAHVRELVALARRVES